MLSWYNWGSSSFIYIICYCDYCLFNFFKMTKNVQGEKTTNPLEQFVILAKTAQGPEAADVIKQVLESPAVYVFGELLDMPNIIELKSGTYAAYFNTLNLFAYGTYRQYLEKQAEFIELSITQIKKLQHLTIVSLATRSKCIPYSVLLQELDVKNVRDLEDLIIEAVYSDIIQGKLDQKNSQLEVDYAIGRDIKWEDIGGIIKTLQEWCHSCEAVLSSIEEQVDKANSEKTASIQHREAVMQRIVSLKKNLKLNVEREDMVTGDREVRENVPPSAEKSKKPVKARSLRTASKIWISKS